MIGSRCDIILHFSPGPTLRHTERRKSKCQNKQPPGQTGVCVHLVRLFTKKLCMNALAQELCAHARTPWAKRATTGRRALELVSFPQRQCRGEKKVLRMQERTMAKRLLFYRILPFPLSPDHLLPAVAACRRTTWNYIA